MTALITSLALLLVLKSDSESDFAKMEAKIDNELQPSSDDSVYETMH